MTEDTHCFSLRLGQAPSRELVYRFSCMNTEKQHWEMVTDLVGPAELQCGYIVH